MFLETKLTDYSFYDTNRLLAAIDSKITQAANAVYGNIVYGFNNKVSYDTVNDLIVLRKVYLDMLKCSDCFCDVDIQLIVAKINQLTNKFC